MACIENLMRGNPETQFKAGAKQTEIARRGGIASGIAKREKKLFKEEIEKKLGQSLESMVDAMIAEAENGNVKAFEVLRDTAGQHPDKIKDDAEEEQRVPQQPK